MKKEDLSLVVKLVVLSVLVSSVTGLMFNVFVYGSPAHGAVPTGTLTITKNTTDGDGTFTFIIQGPTPSNQSVTTTHGTVSIVLTVTEGNYTITEAAQSGWHFDSATCSNGTPTGVAVTAGQTTTCTFSNTKLKPGTLKIGKSTFKGTGTFGITVKGPTPSNQSITTTVTDLDGVGRGSITLTVIPGKYTITETVPPGWSYNGVSSSDNGFISSGSGIIVTVISDKTTSVNFSNSKN